MVRNTTGDEMESLCRFSETMGSLLSNEILKKKKNIRH